MTDKKLNLLIYEALELRNEFDRRIRALEGLTGEKKKERSFLSRDEDELQYAKDFNVESVQEKLKKLQTKRVKLNQELQAANMKAKITYNGSALTLSESLEVKKNLMKDIDILGEKLSDAAFMKVIHKEGRDIVKKPKQKFQEAYRRYDDALVKLRMLNREIHKINHKETVNFKDE